MADVAEIRKTRAVYAYDVPRDDVGTLSMDAGQFGGLAIASVGLVELTADEELQASKKGRGDSFRVAYELAKLSVVEINGKKLDRMAGEDDTAWLAFTAPFRTLVLEAYAEIHSPQEGAKRDFLKSRRVKVG